MRPTPAKAHLRESDGRTVSDQIGLTFGDVVKMVIEKHYGSIKQAAFQLGEGAGLARLDPSLMMREFDAGKLARLEVDAAAKAAVSEALYRTFAQDDPRARAQRLIDESIERLHALKLAVSL